MKAAPGPGRAWVAVGGWALFQFALTSLPAGVVGGGLRHPWDFIAHAGMYGVLGILVVRAAALSGRTAGRLVAWWTVIVLFAALDELHQGIIPGRTPDALDWVSDIAGAAAGLLVGWRMTASAASWLR